MTMTGRPGEPAAPSGTAATEPGTATGINIQGLTKSSRSAARP